MAIDATMVGASAMCLTGCLQSADATCYPLAIIFRMLALLPRSCRPDAAKPHTAMPADEKLHPLKVRFLRLEAILQIPDALTGLIEQAGGAKSACAGFHARSIPVTPSSIKRETR